MKTYLWMGMLMIMSICKAHEGRNFVPSDMLKTMSANDKAAIVMVYFGTTHDDTRTLTIDRLTEQVQETLIIRLFGQLCPTGVRLKNCLSQLDAGRNMIFFLLFDSQMIVPIDILFIRCDLTLP